MRPSTDAIMWQITRGRALFRPASPFVAVISSAPSQGERGGAAWVI
jgi:hypothetical protein